MQNLTSQIPTLLGSFAAMLVAFLSLMNGTSPTTCLFKAVTAFVVCAAFGLVLRHALQMAEVEAAQRENGAEHGFGEQKALESIVPGTSLDEVDQMLAGGANLAVTPNTDASGKGLDYPAQQEIEDVTTQAA